MAKKSSFNKQFKRGAVPDQHWDESTRVSTHEQDAPSKVRRRQGLALGTQAQANPGMVGDSDYSRKRRK